MYSALPAYAELHCLSNFSFLRGASHPEELVQRALELGYAALAITDECSFAGVVRAHVAAKAAGLPLLIGSEVLLQDDVADSAMAPAKLVLLATDRTGYARLSRLITTGRRRSGKGRYALYWSDLEDGLPGCLALLCPQPDPYSDPQSDPQSDPRAQPEPPQALLVQAQALQTRMPGRAWIAVELLGGPEDRAWLSLMRRLSQHTGLPLVAAGDVHMHRRSRRMLQDALTAVRLRRPVHACGLALFPNGERHLRHRLRLGNVYPVDLIEETLGIAARCQFSLDSLRYEYPQELVPDGITPAAHLRQLTEQGLRQRFPQGVPESVRQLIEHELALIAELAYEPYFLTVEDIVRFARSRDILCQGRGSAANSAVCYALGITEVDPARMSMLFERFLSRERREPPDIDVDFEHQRREEVIQYLYARYGRDRAALAASVIRYRPRSALRDMARALDLDPQQADRVSASLVWRSDRQQLAERLQQAGFDPSHPLPRRWLQLAQTLVGFPRHLSQHVGGFVIARGALDELVPIENAAMPERSVIQWDKDDLQALGLLKVDVLALGMLSAIRRALQLVSDWRGQPLRMQDIPAEDAAVYAMIQKADTVGVFQIESRAQMSMLPRLKPATFYDLVIEVAIVRPGPIQGGMVHPYLRRRQGLEPVAYPGEAVRAVLERTLGVPIFQEQVMQLAVVAAGFSPGEADQLRRSMAAWKRQGGLDHFEQRLIQGMLARGYSASFAQQIYQQMLGFGEYGFPESHSASFALLVYVSAWLKCHHPAAFVTALLNSQPMGFYAPSQLVQDARRHGVEVRPVSVNHSHWECRLEAAVTTQHAAEHVAEHAVAHTAPAVRLGLCLVKGLRQAAAQQLVQARGTQWFQSLEQLARRSALSAADLKLLAAAGALDELTADRNQAWWAVAGLATMQVQMPVHDQGELDFHAPLPAVPVVSAQDSPAAPAPPTALPALPVPGEGANIVADYAHLGLTLGRHPLALLRPRLMRWRYRDAGSLRSLPNGRALQVCGIVTGRQRPDTASGVVFVTLEDESGSINVVVWRELAERQRRALLGASLLAVAGVLQRQGEVIHLLARQLTDRSAWLGRLQTASRDFH